MGILKITDPKDNSQFQVKWDNPTPPSQSDVDYIVAHKHGVDSASTPDNNISVGGFAGNVVKSGVQNISSMASAVAHPLNTASNLDDVIIGGISKLIPGDSGITDDYQNKFDAVKNAMIQRYGSWDNVKNTIYKDPVGFALDASTILGLSGGALKTAGEVSKLSTLGDIGNTLTKANEFVNPISLATKGAGAVADVVGQGVKNGSKFLSNREIQSLIKPPSKTFAYGKNPPQGIIDEGIVATSKDDLVNKISDARNQVGQQISQAVSNPQFDSLKIDSSDITKHVDDAITRASRMPTVNKDLITKLQGIKQDLLGSKEVDGSIVYTRNLSEMSPIELQQLKQDIGDATKYTGNPSDDTAINTALQKAYRSIDSKLDDNIPGIEKLNERYANLSGAFVAARNNALRAGNRNIQGLAETGLGAGALATGIATGRPIEGAIAGVALPLAYKAVGSTPVKTATAWALNRGGVPIGNGISNIGKIGKQVAPSMSVPSNLANLVGNVNKGSNTNIGNERSDLIKLLNP
jgi:hypothetical protein